MSDDGMKDRANWIGGAEYHNLTLACAALQDAFGHGSVYLVGSSLRKRDFRDVDIRVIIDDAHYDRLFPGLTGNPSVHALWSIMCASISEWLKGRTGLPIDFQIQKRSEANERFPIRNGAPPTSPAFRANERNAIGLFLDPNFAALPTYPGGG